MQKHEYLAYHRDFCDRMVAINQRKSTDYCGDNPDPFANFRVVEKIGIASVEQGFLTRMSDKFVRIANLSDGRNAAVTDESIEDTLQDLANYCALFAGYLHSKRSGKQVTPSTSWIQDLGDALHQGAQERYYEIVAKGRSGEIVVESCPDVELAVNRLDSIRADWPTFQLSIREVGCEYEDDIDGNTEAS